MKAKLLKLRQKQEGLTTVEYAVAGALVTLAVVGAFQLLGGNVANVINTIAGFIVAP